MYNKDLISIDKDFFTIYSFDVHVLSLQTTNRGHIWLICTQDLNIKSHSFSQSNSIEFIVIISAKGVFLTNTDVGTYLAT